MGLSEPPTYDERPPRGGLPLDDLPRDERDGPTWEEKHTADAVTVKMRKRVSALASSFNAVMKAAGVDDACRALDLDPNEIRRLYFVLVETAQRTEYKAEAAGQLPPRLRRFTLPCRPTARAQGRPGRTRLHARRTRGIIEEGCEGEGRVKFEGDAALVAQARAHDGVRALKFLLRRLGGGVIEVKRREAAAACGPRGNDAGR